MSKSPVDGHRAKWQVSVACRTDKGRTRPINEDSWVVCDLEEPPMRATEELNNHLISGSGFLLAGVDGMGGAQAGEVASRLAIEQLVRRLTASSQKEEISDRLSDGLKSANRAISHTSRENSNYSGMGATVTAALINDGRAVIGQVGDSRGYLIRDGEVRQVTKDQSLVQVLLDMGQLTEEEAKGSRQRHVILQALGVQDEVTPEMTTIILAQGDQLMLCSDYLMQKVTKAEVLDTIRESGSLVDVCARLVSLANERGGEDNITVLIARFDGPALPELQDKTD